MFNPFQQFYHRTAKQFYRSFFQRNHHIINAGLGSFAVLSGGFGIYYAKLSYLNGLESSANTAALTSAIELLTKILEDIRKSNEDLKKANEDLKKSNEDLKKVCEKLEESIKDNNKNSITMYDILNFIRFSFDFVKWNKNDDSSSGNVSGVRDSNDSTFETPPTGKAHQSRKE